jgi:hypothetical protein
LSTTTKTFGFNKPELTDAADITAMNQNWDKADDEIAKAKGTNPNLLDNWYFADPINQRAQSSYSGSGYGIDRWTMIEADGSVKLESDGITVYRQLRQYIENPNDVFGKQITASVLTSDGTLHTGTMTPANSDGGQLIVDDTTIHLYMYIVKSATSGNVSFIIECRESVTIKAVKLEFGSQQTLARQDGTGKWVLNSMPPNKTLETIKCGSSTDDVNDPYANSKMLYKNLGAAPATESSDYPGCYYRTINGVTEWINPPMIVGVEYRTTERSDGNPTYVKAIEIPMTTSGYKKVKIASGMTEVKSIEIVTYSKLDLGYYHYGLKDIEVYGCEVNLGDGNFQINTAQHSSLTVKAIIKYCRS